jgi:hypothetical protein
MSVVIVDAPRRAAPPLPQSLPRRELAAAERSEPAGESPPLVAAAAADDLAGIFRALSSRSGSGDGDAEPALAAALAAVEAGSDTAVRYLWYCGLPLAAGGGALLRAYVALPENERDSQRQTATDRQTQRQTQRDSQTERQTAMLAWLAERGAALRAADVVGLPRAAVSGFRQHLLRRVGLLPALWAALFAGHAALFVAALLWDPRAPGGVPWTRGGADEPHPLVEGGRLAWLATLAGAAFTLLAYGAAAGPPGTSRDAGAPRPSSVPGGSGGEDWPWPMCLSCNLPRPARARHCDRCRACVLRMDHHCDWTNRCVGARNHGFFLYWLAAQVFVLVLFAAGRLSR